MKILRVHATFQTEFKYYEHYLSEVFQTKNVFTTFLTTDKLEKGHKAFLKNPEVLPGEYDFNGSKLIRLKALDVFGKQFIVEIRKMYSIITRTDYEVLHLYGFGNPIGFLTIFLSKFKRGDVIIVASDHSDPNKVKGNIFAKLYFLVNLLLFKTLGQRIRRIFVPNTAGKKLIEKRYNIKNPDLVKVIPLGFDPRLFNFDPIKKNTNKKLVIGFAGKIVENKRIEFLIDALSQWSVTKYEFIAVGVNIGSLSEYQKRIIKYAEKKNVIVTFLPLKKVASELSEFYNYIDLAIYPGTISITTFEANGCGTPILLFNSIEGLEDRVENGRGVLFNTQKELLELMEKFYQDKKNNAINNSNIEMNTSKYTFEEIGNIYLGEYSKLLSDIV